jgi:hypothetical protein
MAHEIHQICGILTILNCDLVGIFADHPHADATEHPGPGQGVGHDPSALADHLR